MVIFLLIKCFIVINEAIQSDYIERLKEYADVRLEVSKSIIVHNMIENESENIERKE